MKILVLTNNAVSQPLCNWLAGREYVAVRDTALTPEDLVLLAPDLVVSYCYRHILKSDVVEIMPQRFINLHISLLPYNRGADPNVWSFLEDTPKGVTVHLIDAGIDTGPILLQQPLKFDEYYETLAGAYASLHSAIQKLFTDNWNLIKIGSLAPKVQVSTGTYHRSADFAQLKDKLLGAEGWDVPIRLLRERYRHLNGSA